MIPLPTNIFPYWFFPWNTDTWSGYTQFIFHKELLAIDTLRQLFVWKEYCFSLLRQGIWPLWNPYNFSGQPLIANFQSSIFYPLSWFFAFLSSKDAWSVYIFSQPILAGLFFYLYLYYSSKNKLSALMGTISLLTCGFFATRYFWGVYLHPLIWLPAALLTVDLFKNLRISKLLFTILASIEVSLIILAGYPQIAFLALSVFFSYALFRLGFKKILLVLASIILALGITSAQMLPTAELYQNSLREGKASEKNFGQTMILPQHFITTLSVDFFGNPANNNYAGKGDYSGVNMYVGIIPLMFAIYGIFNFKKDKKMYFWGSIGIIGIIFALDSPIAWIPYVFNIPILSSGSPWNTLILYHISIAILSSYGFAEYIKNKHLFPLKIAGVVLLLQMILLFIGYKLSLPFKNTLFLMSATTLFIGANILPKKLSVIVCLLISILFGCYYVLKMSPFGEEKYFYPSHVLIRYLQSKNDQYRFFGYGGARIATNLATHYKIYSPEGYDSLSPKWIGELYSTTDLGKFPDYINRADILISEKDTVNRERILNLMGVKYFLDKSDVKDGDNGANVAKYPPNKFSLLEQWGPISIYENKLVLPRVFMADSYVVTIGEEAIKKIYDPELNLARTLIFEIDPHVDNLGLGDAEISEYGPNAITIRTKNVKQSLLFLSDTYFPGWKASINGKEAKIIKADYAFRAIIVPAGENVVKLTYQPESFRDGLVVSLFSLFVMLCLGLKVFLKRIGR